MVLAAALTLQAGLFLASAAQPVWLDAFSHVRLNPYLFLFWLAILEFYSFLFSLLLLVIALVMRVTSSLSATDAGLSVVPRTSGVIHEEL
jgi:hypothetical protein